jgi:hypothetical protein
MWSLLAREVEVMRCQSKNSKASHWLIAGN